MRLKDISYFARMEQRLPDTFEVLSKVARKSQQQEPDATEFQRRLAKVANHPNPMGEQQWQAADFACEMIAFDVLIKKGYSVHWVEESDSPMPDLSINRLGGQRPVEVKHLNAPRDEQVAFAAGKWFMGDVNHDFNIPVEKKVADLIEDSKKKFRSFHHTDETESESGIVYLYFSKGGEAMIMEPSNDIEQIIRTKCLSLANGQLQIEVARLGSEPSPV